jgi:hypothetical protein
MKLDITSKDFRKTQIPSFKKIRSVGAELFQAHGQLYMKKLTVDFRSCANAPKNRRTYGCTIVLLHDRQTEYQFRQAQAIRTFFPTVPGGGAYLTTP